MAKDSRFNGRTVEEMRVYAPNNGSLAYKSDYLYDTRLAAAQPKRRQETAAPAETQPKIRPQKTRIPLTVIRKKNGGKADALNLGINAARYPYFICMDALCQYRLSRFNRLLVAQFS